MKTITMMILCQGMKDDEVDDHDDGGYSLS